MINEILNKYSNNEKSGIITGYSLDNIQSLLSHLNNPHKNFKSLHIAGTNGKGSTAYMLSAVLEKSGYKTALYTSPHLVKINERIKINSKDIDDALLYVYLKNIDEIVCRDNTIEPTYFDILTAAAFKYFSDESVDIAVIETGLGGRLDSTNIITPEISIITDISMDHTNILGDKISEITEEKCGIIKKDKIVITSNIDPGIFDIIQKHSVKSHAELYSFNKDFFTNNVKNDNGHFVFDYESENYKLPDVEIQLFPEHQVKNAAVVITALNLLKSGGFNLIKDEIIYKELKEIKVPGRFQTLSINPIIKYDPAHNFNALNNLISAINNCFSGMNIIYIISMMNDKADKKTLELFTSLNAIYLLLNDQRAYIPAQNEFKDIIAEDHVLADKLKELNRADTMFIFTGTFRIYKNAVHIAEQFNDNSIKT